jgi:hypothetical protein
VRQMWKLSAEVCNLGSSVERHEVSWLRQTLFEAGRFSLLLQNLGVDTSMCMINVNKGTDTYVTTRAVYPIKLHKRVVLLDLAQICKMRCAYHSIKSWYELS